jgi:phosphopantothenoylcysteine decarboxylase/phosphopantothenate--cysteine ligase
MNGKNILLIITGGIAAVKVPELIRQMKQKGFDVTPLLTGAAKKFCDAIKSGCFVGF